MMIDPHQNESFQPASSAIDNEGRFHKRNLRVMAILLGFLLEVVLLPESSAI